MDFYGMSGLGWYDFARSRGFTGTPQQLMDIMLGNISAISDHNALNNRDMQGQHPIDAIIGLRLALDGLEDDIKGINASDGWRTVQIYPAAFQGAEADKEGGTVIGTSAEQKTNYTVSKDEIDILSGVWELELIVLGLKNINGGEQIPTGTHAVIGLYDRMQGLTNKYDLFSVPLTQASGKTQPYVQRQTAVIAGGNAIIARSGYVGEAFVNEEYYQENTTEHELPFVNSIVVQAATNVYQMRTYGMYLRYRKIAE